MIVALAILAISQRLVFADGAWASFDRGGTCVAMTRSARVAPISADQAQANFTFDRTGGRHGQLGIRLSRPLRPGGTALLTVGTEPFLLVAGNGFAWSRGPMQEQAILAAARAATGMRIEGRSPAGGRFVDNYSLDGAPGAIDAAAACAARR